jgi:hypothetical protein
MSIIVTFIIVIAGLIVGDTMLRYRERHKYERKGKR